MSLGKPLCVSVVVVLVALFVGTLAYLPKCISDAKIAMQAAIEQLRPRQHRFGN